MPDFNGTASGAQLDALGSALAGGGLWELVEKQDLTDLWNGSQGIDATHGGMFKFEGLDLLPYTRYRIECSMLAELASIIVGGLGSYIHLDQDLTTADPFTTWLAALSAQYTYSVNNFVATTKQQLFRDDHIWSGGVVQATDIWLFRSEFEVEAFPEPAGGTSYWGKIRQFFVAYSSGDEPNLDGQWYDSFTNAQQTGTKKLKNLIYQPNFYDDALKTFDFASKVAELQVSLYGRRA